MAQDVRAAADAAISALLVVNAAAGTGSECPGLGKLRRGAPRDSHCHTVSPPTSLTRPPADS